MGSRQFYHLGAGKAGEIHEEAFTVDTSHLRNGRYRTVYVLFEISSSKESAQIVRTDGLTFEIDDPAREEEILWHRDWWGSTLL